MNMRNVFIVTLLLILPARVVAEDWPQWRGPNRDGVSKEKGLLQAWPKNGPPLKWTFKNAGLGFSSFAVVGDRLYTMGAREDSTYVIALDVKTGKEVWSHKVSPKFTFKGNIWGDGPRSTPTLDRNFLYALSGDGTLVCIDIEKREEKWRKSFVKDFGGEMMTRWGYSESVLIDGDKLICTPGGKQGTLACLDKTTGEVLWRSKGLIQKAPYSSIIPATLAGTYQYVQASYVEGKGFLNGVDASTGKLLWSGQIVTGAADYIAPTPVISGNAAYMSTDTSGAVLLEIKGNKGDLTAKSVYGRLSPRSNPKVGYGGVVLIDGHIYGHGGRLGWVAQEIKTGKVQWYERFKLQCQTGSIVAADNCLYLYSDRGDCVLLKVNAKQWEEVGRFKIPEKSKSDSATQQSALVWTHPVVANERLYLRDQELIFSFDVSAKK